MEPCRFMPFYGIDLDSSENVLAYRSEGHLISIRHRVAFVALSLRHYIFYRHAVFLRRNWN